MDLKRVALSILVVVVILGSLLTPSTAETKPLYTINASQFRVPVVGNFEITRVGGRDAQGNSIYASCVAHSGRNGATYMDINQGSYNADAGTPIYASGDGTIDLAAYNIDNPVGGADVGGFGNYIDLHSHGVSFLYAHLSKVYVTTGQYVQKGQLIGLLGGTGWSTSAHLHWEAKALGGETFNMYDINGVEENLSAPCGDGADGSISTQHLSGNPYNSCQSFASNNYSWPAFFDGKDCTGNMFAWHPPYAQTASFNDQNGWNDRIRSVYVPSGWAVKVGGNVNNNPTALTKCFTSSQTDLDSVTYDQAAVKIGYDWNTPDHRNGWDMASYIAVGSSCNALASAVGGFLIGAGSDSAGSIGGYASGSGSGYNTVAIFDNSDCSGTQYGWHIPTGGWYDLNSANGPDYMNNAASCVHVDSGWSVKMSEGFGGNGALKCIAGPSVRLGDATYYNGTNMDNNVSSVYVYNDSTCGGTAPEGVSSGDTVTVHIDPGYSGTQYGWHFAAVGNVPDYVRNKIDSIGVVPGWSVAVYENQNQGGGAFCFSQSDANLSGDLFDNDAGLGDNIESIGVYQDTTCGGLAAPSNVSLTYDITNPETRTISAVISWSNAAPKWHLLDWGDGSNTGVYGASGSNTYTHQYDAGDYTIKFSVNGHDRQEYSVTEPLSLPEYGCGSTPVQESFAVYEFGNCAYVNEEDFAELAPAGQQPVYYNLSEFGLDNQISSLHFQVNGSITSARLYEGEDKTGQSVCRNGGDMWSMSQDQWPNQTAMDNSVSSIEVFRSVGCVPPPQVTMNYSWLEPHGQIQLDLTWSGGATGSWQIVDWGDGTDWGVQGASGTASPTHWYASPGTYQVDFTVLSAEPDWTEYTFSTTVVVDSWECGSAVSQSGVSLYRFSTCAYRDNTDFEEFVSDGTYNLSGLDNAATSLHVPSGKSVRLYEGANQTGDSMCVSWDMWAMDLDNWPLGGSLNDSVSSIRVFSNTNCTP